jgi:hypothetical protein
MVMMTMEQEVELAKATFEHVRNDGREFHQMFQVMAYDGQITVGVMDEETADNRADALVYVVHSLQASQVVFMSDVWYRVLSKENLSPAREAWMRQTLVPDDGIMPSQDPDRKEAFIVARFRPGSVEYSATGYEMVDGKVVWDSEPLGSGAEFMSNTYPRVREALAVVRLQQGGMK